MSSSETPPKIRFVEGKYHVAIACTKCGKVNIARRNYIQERIDTGNQAIFCKKCNEVLPGELRGLIQLFDTEERQHRTSSSENTGAGSSPSLPVNLASASDRPANVTEKAHLDQNLQRAVELSQQYETKLQELEEGFRRQIKKSDDQVEEILGLWDTTFEKITSKVADIERKLDEDVNAQSRGLDEIKNLLQKAKAIEPRLSKSKDSLQKYFMELQNNVNKLTNEGEAALKRLRERLDDANALLEQPERGKAKPADGNKVRRVPEIRLSSDSLQDVAQIILKEAFPPALLRELVNQYHTSFSPTLDGASRRRLIERLPELFDFVEIKLRALQKEQNSAENTDVVKALERLQRQIETWQNTYGIDRFPKPGEPFCIAVHDTEGTIYTDNPLEFDKIKEVVRTGYKIRENGEVLRNARVIRYVERRPGKEP